MHIQLKHPFTMILSGPSGCGKTTFVCNLLKNLKVINRKINKIIWCNSEVNAIPSQVKNIPNIEFLNNIPENFNNDGDKPMLVILDDMMSDVNSSKKVCELFTRGSHHRNISVISISQNIFHQGKHCRDISLNAKYIVVFKNPRDQTQFLHLARQLYPENTKDLLRVYKEATNKPYGYLLIDLSQGIYEFLRFRTNIFNKSISKLYCSDNQLENTNGITNEKIKGQPAYALRIEKC